MQQNKNRTKTVNGSSQKIDRRHLLWAGVCIFSGAQTYFIFAAHKCITSLRIFEIGSDLGENLYNIFVYEMFL